MDAWIDVALVLLILSNLRLLGSSRLGACIRTVAAQGILLGVLTVLLNRDALTLHTLAIAGGGMAIKGVAFPWLLFRALREARVQREIEPFVGFNVSILAGVLMLGVSLWIGARLPLPGRGGPEAALAVSPLVVPVALFTILAGLFLIVSRRKALTQVLGYLVLENGIYAFGVAILLRESFLVELGVLLDVFVAVFVMGIAIFHISREFDHIETDLLATLKD